MPLKDHRRRATLALLTVCVVFTALVVPLIASAVAQSAPRIQIINPSDFQKSADDPRPVTISDEKTGDDEEDGENEETYRLNAVSANTPTDAVVEFELASGVINTTVGTADRVANDTWEINWEIPPSVTDGQYTIRAILYSGSGEFAEEVARDERPVIIFAGHPQAQTSAETVDINYPENGQPAGFYTHPLTGVTNILVDFEYSDGTDAVYIYYTLSDPGDEPVWKQCNLEFYDGTAGPGHDRLRCDLETQDQGGQSVTGVAAVANDDDTQTADPTTNESGDAVRVLPFKQDPTAITIDRDTVKVDQNNATGAFPCSTAQMATVEDQLGRPIAGLSVDVHATGPSDQLKFNTAGTPPFAGPPSANKPPDPPHPTEGARTCSSPTQNIVGRQGDHNRVGVPDRKHIETAAIGDAGTFGVNMFSDSAGVTQLTFWADEDDDDKYCSQELAAAASIGWEENAPQPVVDTAEVTVCPIPTPPPPGSTATPTGGTTSPSSSTSQTPDPRGCTVTGTDGDDDLEGTQGDDVICGLGGDDTIQGLGGNDVIHGDDGEDRVFAGAGNDTVDGGAGVDGITGEGGNDAIDGGGALDVISGGGGDDTLRGTAGNDILIGGKGRDILIAGSGKDENNGGAGDDIIKGGTGNDKISGKGGADNLRGGPQNDAINGEGGPDSIRGGPGKDRCKGGAGRDRVSSCEK